MTISTTAWSRESWLTGERLSIEAETTYCAPVVSLVVDASVPIVLANTAPLDSVLSEFEAKPDLARRMAAARARIAQIAYGEQDSLAGMRLAAGLSQAALAEKAKTTQPYIARIESGTVDPGTEVIARLAAGLGVEPARVFNAILQARSLVSKT